MTATKENLFEAALHLSIEDRAELAQRLMDSLPEGTDPVLLMDPDVRKAWNEEIQRRIKKIDRSETELIPGEEVFAELRARYKRDE